MHYWLKNVRIETGYRTQGNWIAGTESRTVAIEIKDGCFVQIIDEADFEAPGNMTIFDGRDQLILPGLVEKHCHLDKSKLGTPWTPITPAKNLVERFETEIPILDHLPLPLTERAKKLMRLELIHGVTGFRSHVDIEPMTGLRYYQEIKTIQATSQVPIEIVLFPQHGLLRSQSIPLIEAALEEGAQYIGGVDPYSLDGDYQTSLRETFALADRYGVGVDLHLHDRGEAGTKTIKEMIRLTRQYCLQDQVFISHAFGLNDFIGAERNAVFQALADEQIHIISSVPITPNTIPPIPELRNYGVQVHLGCDNIDDCWSPYGDGSLPQKLARLGELFGITAQDQLTQLLGLVTDGLTTLDSAGHPTWPKVGDEATYLLTNADCAAAFVARQNPVTSSAYRGNLIK